MRVESPNFISLKCSSLSVFGCTPSQMYSSYSNCLSRDVKLSRDDPDASYLHSRAKPWHWMLLETHSLPYPCEVALRTMQINNSQRRRAERNLLLRSSGWNVDVRRVAPANCSPRLLPQEGSQSPPDLTFYKATHGFLLKELLEGDLSSLELWIFVSLVLSLSLV